MYIANHLATEYEKSSRVKSLLDNMEFVMVPIVNPDGIAVCVCVTGYCMSLASVAYYIRNSCSLLVLFGPLTLSKLTYIKERLCA